MRVCMCVGTHVPGRSLGLAAFAFPSRPLPAAATRLWGDGTVPTIPCIPRNTSAAPCPPHPRMIPFIPHVPCPPIPTKPQ